MLLLTHCLKTSETNYLNLRASVADGHPPCAECHTLTISTQTPEANIKTNSLSHNRGSLWTRLFAWHSWIRRSFEIIMVAQAVNDASDLYSESILREFRLPSRSENWLFWVITQRVVVTSLPKFRDSLSVPFSEFKNPWITTTRCVITQKWAVLREYPFRILPETPVILHLLRFFSVTLDVEESSVLQ
jgi:hypothetical protein